LHNVFKNKINPKETKNRIKEIIQATAELLFDKVTQEEEMLCNIRARVKITIMTTGKKKIILQDILETNFHDFKCI
jgi:hypothetical protein